MAVYKVPQDVEAEDKLIGWLSFRQLVYAGISVGAAALTFFMFQVFPPLILIPLPIAIIFGILVLPLRKDQPLETYLISIVRFYLKPKLRKWDSDGVESYVEITVPVREEQPLTKDLSPEAAQERLDYLARIMDSRGWAYKQLNTAPYADNLSSDIAAEASTAVDVLDEQNNVSRSFKTLIDRKDAERRQTAIERMQKAQSEPTITAQPTAVTAATDQSGQAASSPPTFNPYPSSMHQKMILPSGSKPRVAPKAPATPMTPKVSPAIMELANNDSLSVSTIANEAKRLQEKEVVIKLH